ncbi:MAG: hypothetical protein JW744_03060 [Candidatus Diapherotrites archaeon]|uniref:Uncharacterized protein n=1 Tax=Candidatus Iainarchaeum sp. TaxID=3101447 RepID=A0A938YR89_9ARCH|nr:hypothetical protein [Candidatus Diapherotrites archaeon]
MKPSGQVQLEATACFAVFLALLGLMLFSLNQADANLERAKQGLKAGSEAQLCCIALDSAYTGNAEQVSTSELHCTADNTSFVESRAGSIAKTQECIAQEIKSVQRGQENFLEVKPGGHYS